MEKINITITKDTSINKVRSEIKDTIFNDLLETYRETFGDESVTIVRIDKTNYPALIVGNATDEMGDTYPIVVTLNPTVKEFCYHGGPKTDYVPFDLAAGINAYQADVAKKAEDAIKKAEKDAEKAAAKAKAKAEAEKASAEVAGF